MNRYLSSERWRKVKAGWYESPDGKYDAWRSGSRWKLISMRWAVPLEKGTFLTLADCQEHAERLERRDASV